MDEWARHMGDLFSRALDTAGMLVEHLAQGCIVLDHAKRHNVTRGFGMSLVQHWLDRRGVQFGNAPFPGNGWTVSRGCLEAK